MNRRMSNLWRRLELALESNPSKDAPYHNNDHLKGMTLLALEFWETEKTDVGLGNWAEEVIMFACMLHDYNHSAGKDTDATNVENARTFAAEFIHRHGFMLPGAVIAAIDNAIAVTQFPFVHTPQNKLEQVIRDADLLWATSTLDPKIIIEGLREELRTAGKVLSREQMLSQQESFHRNAVLFTAAGRNMMDDLGEVYLNTLRQYIMDMRDQSEQENK